MIVINWSWNLLQLFWICEITFGSIAHCYFLELIVFWFKGLKSISHGLIHVWHLFLNSGNTWWQMESLEFSNGKYLVSKISIMSWRIFCGWWRVTALKVNSSSWEPCKFGSWLHWPIWLISSGGFNDLLTGHLW